MAEIEVTIPTVPYGNVKVRGESALEVLAVLQDPNFLQMGSTVLQALGATESDEEVLPEGEALDALKTALGASESPERALADLPIINRTPPSFRKVVK